MNLAELPKDPLWWIISFLEVPRVVSPYSVDVNYAFRAMEAEKAKSKVQSKANRKIAQHTANGNERLVTLWQKVKHRPAYEPHPEMIRCMHIFQLSQVSKRLHDICMQYMHNRYAKVLQLTINRPKIAESARSGIDMARNYGREIVNSAKNIITAGAVTCTVSYDAVYGGVSYNAIRNTTKKRYSVIMNGVIIEITHMRRKRAGRRGIMYHTNYMRDPKQKLITFVTTVV